MGLDAVELILRAEEIFNISISDQDASQVVTVFDFYELILRGMQLTVPAAYFEVGRDRSKLTYQIQKWKAEDVWPTLVSVFVHQLGLKLEKVVPTARIVEDLGVD